MSVKKFNIGDIVNANGRMDNPTFLYGEFEVVGIRNGDEDLLLDLVNLQTGRKHVGYYQYRFELLKPRKKGNYEQYNKSR